MTEDGKQATVGKRRCMIYRLGYESFLQLFIFSVYIVPDMSLFGLMTMTVDLHEPFPLFSFTIKIKFKKLDDI